VTEPSWAAGTRLRLARQARGLSQQQLAGMAAVTRQAVSAVESGHSDPSLRVALALARALGMTVEELFGPGDPADPVLAQPVAPVGGEGSRVALATVGDTFVALPLSADTLARAGFGPAGGLVVGRESHGDLITWWPCGNGEALRLAAAGLVHAAGVHQGGDEAEIPDGAELVGFTCWREGLVFRPATPITGLDDAVRRGLRLVNREPGAQARKLLDRELARLGLDPAGLPGYDSQAAGHLQVAAAVAGRLADVGVASEPAALAYGLNVIPLASERFDLVLPAKHAASREVQGLLRVLTSPWLLAQLASLPGYGAARCGERSS
jgi:putative molybdopterin biosynthesis protein